MTRNIPALLLVLAVAACAAPERPGWVRPDLDPAWLSAKGEIRWPP